MQTTSSGGSASILVGGGPVVAGNPLPVLDTIGQQSLQASGTSAAPGAGAAVATITTPAQGMYRVRMTYQLSGTAETAVKNLRLAGATFTGDFPTIGTAITTVVVDNVSMDGAANLRAVAVAAATAGSVYTVTIVATRLF